MKLSERLEQDQLLGVIRLNNKYSFFTGGTADWNMDYKKYDPSYNPAEWTYVFRNNILQVDENNAQQYCETMDKVSAEIVIDTIRQLGASEVILYFLIDFDNKLYINYYFDLSLEDYVPVGWKGLFDNPLNHVPDTIRSIWKINSIQ